MSGKLISKAKLRTLLALAVISCYLFVSFAQSPGQSTVRRIEKEEQTSAKQRPQRSNNAIPTKNRDQSDTSDNTLVDYDADVMTSHGDKIMRLVGNVHFHHNGAIIQCDSALRYNDNRIECFGKVIIEKDSAYIYGDRVNYDERANVADVYAPIVKMTQGSTTLYSYNLQFNTKTNIGTFVNGGVLSQKHNKMEAERGSFDAKSEYAKFQDSVAMRNDDYVVRTDSMGYDSKSERVDFLDRTYIWSKDSNFLMADYGNYFTATKTYLFTSNAYAMTPDNEAWADTMRYITEGRRVYMFSNVQILDTANATVSFGDWGYYDDSIGRAILTIKPSIRSWDKGDTSYMKADTIMMLTFDAGKSKLADDEFDEDSVTSSVHNSSTPTASDTTIIVDSLSMADDSLLTRYVARDSILAAFVARDSLAVKDSIVSSIPPDTIATDTTIITDTLPPEMAAIADSSIVAATEVEPEADPAPADSIAPPSMPEPQPTPGPTPVAAPAPTPPLETPPADEANQKPTFTADQITLIDWVEYPYVDRKTHSPAGQLPLWDQIDVGDIMMIRDTVIADSSLLSHAQFLTEDSLARAKARADSIKKTEKERVIRAYHKVRLWSKEYQGACDSTVSFSIDSTAVMYGEPVLWSKSNQITAEQIDMYTKDEHLDWADFTGEPFIAQQVTEGDTSKFNQATGKRLETYFSNDELDYAYMSGNVQNIYYMDENREVVALASITCAELTIIFADREPTRMIWQGQGEGPIYPIEKVPEDQKRFLEGFTWQDSLRPKSAYEICQRTEVPSKRAQCTLYQRPTFRIDDQMERSKEYFRTAGQWTDRNDIPNVTPEYFTERNRQLLF